MGQEFSATIPHFSREPSLAVSYLVLSTHVGDLYSEMKLFCPVIPVNSALPVEIAG